jgi:hypothetical protein
MSADHDHANHEEGHTGPIKTPKQLAWAVFFAFVVPVIIIIMLAAQLVLSLFSILTAGE